jgi:hypothetical protein
MPSDEPTIVDTLHELLNRDPFTPFTLILTSGDRVKIANPNLLAIGASQFTYYFPRSDRWAMLRLNQIAMVKSNGADKKKISA